VTVDDSRKGVSADIGPYPEGTTFKVEELTTGLTKSYEQPKITVTGPVEEEDGMWYYIEAVNTLKTDDPEDPTDPTDPIYPDDPDDDDGPGDPPDSEREPGGRSTITINDLPVPLADLPGLFTIFDGEVPLGMLPFTGAGKALGGLGAFAALALIAGVALRLVKRKNDDGE
jgi:hypothetical protein